MSGLFGPYGKGVDGPDGTGADAPDEVRREAHAAGPDDEFPFVFRVLERR